MCHATLVAAEDGFQNQLSSSTVDSRGQTQVIRPCNTPVGQQMAFHDKLLPCCRSAQITVSLVTFCALCLSRNLGEVGEKREVDSEVQRVTFGLGGVLLSLTGSFVLKG